MKLAGIGLLLLAGCTVLPPQQPPLVEALNKWAERNSLQLIVPVCDRLAQPANAIRRSDPETELLQLLSGTGLDFKQINWRTVAIVCPQPRLPSGDKL